MQKRFLLQVLLELWKINIFPQYQTYHIVFKESWNVTVYILSSFYLSNLLFEIFHKN